MSVTDTIALELLRGRSTKIIHVQYLSNTGQGQSQQTALGSLRRLEASSPSLLRMDTGRIDFGSAGCCMLSHQQTSPHGYLKEANSRGMRRGTLFARKKQRREKNQLINNTTPPYNVPINKEKEEHGQGRLSQMLPRRCSSADVLCTANKVALLVCSHHLCYCSAIQCGPLWLLLLQNTVPLLASTERDAASCQAVPGELTWGRDPPRGCLLADTAAFHTLGWYSSLHVAPGSAATAGNPQT